MTTPNRCPSVLVVLLLASSASVAHAEEPKPVTASLALERAPGAEGCLDAASLSAAVNRRWARDVFVAGDDGDIRVVARFEPRAPGFAATLALARREGESLGTRELVTASSECSALDDSLALAVGLMLDVSRRRLEEERRTEALTAPPAAAPAPAPVPPEPSIAIPSDTYAPRAETHYDVWAGGEGTLGLFPSLSFAGRLGFGIEPPRFPRMEVSGSWFFPDDAPGPAGRGARLSAWTLEAALCPLAFRGERVRVHGCVTERLGQVRATGFGFRQTSRVTEPLSAVGLGAAATLRLAPPFGLRLGLRAELPVVRYRFVFTDGSGDTGLVYGMSPVSLGAEVGVDASW